MGRARSLHAVRSSVADNQGFVVIVPQTVDVAKPEVSQIHRFGTLAQIVGHPPLDSSPVQVYVHGHQRVRLANLLDDGQGFWTEIAEVSDVVDLDKDALLMRALRGDLERIAELSADFARKNAIAMLRQIEDPVEFSEQAASQLGFLTFSEKCQLLEESSVSLRLQRIFEGVSAQLEKLEQASSSAFDKKAPSHPQGAGQSAGFVPPFAKVQVENAEDNEVFEILHSIDNCLCNEEIKERLRKEVQKLAAMQAMSSEATVIRNYLDWMLSMPWGIYTQDSHDISESQKILAREHHGLEKPKERILEFLAVQSLVSKLKGPILCFVGPPGVGKTSLAASVAHAMGRNFIRMSLGGVRDEAEIRGHRRTYIGAMPGKIMQMLRRAKSANPVFLLDEIDKISSDYRGDPASALLEVLDPEQNAKFNDHYIDADFDLSDVVFIATANSLETIPLPLRDRMEIIEIESYTEEDKLQIAKTYLVPKQMAQNGIDVFDVRFTDAALRLIINGYTLEAGVRSLEREISSICRKVACDLLKKKDFERSCTLTPAKVKAYLGRAKIRARKIESTDEVGITTGLAVTMAGGTTLRSEVGVVNGSGKLIITGQIKDLMQESAHAAMSYVRSRAECLGLASDFSARLDIHIHFPGDHAPKDGPSAGITMATSIISALTQIPVKRDIAMTGEITLRGRVLSIGGLRDKLLAAKRHGIKTVLIPKDNLQDYEEIPQKLVSGLQIKAVKTMDEVVLLALKLDPEQRRKLSCSLQSQVGKSPELGETLPF